MGTKDKIEKIYNKMRIIGTAISRVNGNNTHSGNLSMRDPEDENIFYITSSGAQCGSLVPEDIVPIKFSDVSWGDARGSTESAIHRKILSLPGVNAVIHAHYINTIAISFDTKDKQLFMQYIGVDEKKREQFQFHPVDIFGAFAVGGVTVGSFFQPVGSEEMERRIPKYLSEHFLTIVRGHGPFVRGTCLEDALYRLSVLESSAKLALMLRRKGVDIVAIQKKIAEKGREKFFPAKVHLLEPDRLCENQIRDKTIITDFQQRLSYNYGNMLSAYGAGSMSQKISFKEMIYCPMSACPDGLDFPLYKKKLDFEDSDNLDMRLHKLIYNYTHQNACMITTNPAITAEAMSVLADKFGPKVLMSEKTDIPYQPANHPVIVPIDAEAIYLNPKVGLVDISQLADYTENNPILNMLRWYKGCCAVAGYGVISTGKTTLEQAAHNASSAERIGQFRSEVYVNEKLLDGPTVSSFEPR